MKEKNMVKKLIFSMVIAISFLISCNSNKDIPDVSNIKIDVKLERFEKDFFAIDTNHLDISLQKIIQKYPHFTPDFVYNILGLNLNNIIIPGNPEQKALSSFIKDYKPMIDSADLLFGNFQKQEREIKNGLQFVKYYFPEYQLPKAIITFLGPIDASFLTSFGTQGDILTQEGLGVGLQLHMGSNFSAYRSPMGQEIYPYYMSANFDPAHIPVNCMHNIIDDIFPTKASGDPLIDQMVDKGKRLYLLLKFLPYTDENICLGYTEKQLKESYNHEALIWQFFMTNDLLNISDQNIVKNYIGEGPRTAELGDDAPGNIGSFSGLQIVKKFMIKFPETTLNELMKLAPRDVYSRSKYKPKS